MKGLKAIRSSIVLGQRLVKLRPDLYTPSVLEGVIEEYLKMNYVEVEKDSIIPYRIALQCNLDKDTHLLGRVLEDTKLLKKFLDEHSSVVLEKLVEEIEDEVKVEGEGLEVLVDIVKELTEVKDTRYTNSKKYILHLGVKTDIVIGRMDYLVEMILFREGVPGKLIFSCQDVTEDKKEYLTSRVQKLIDMLD